MHYTGIAADHSTNQPCINVPPNLTVWCWAKVVARCALSTSFGGAFGGCTGLLCYLIYSKLVMKEGVWDLCAASNGALTGMVVITSGCATYEPW